MKKLLVTTIAGFALIGATVSSFAQGTITWNNSNSTATSGTPAIFGNGPNAGTRVTGTAGQYEYGLYVGAIGDTSISQMTLVSTYLNSSAAAFAGFISGGAVTLPSGFPDGTAIADIVAGWTAADGHDYLSAIEANPADFQGLSAIGSVTPNNPNGQVFGHTIAGQITGLTLTSAPEPTTIALGGLGAAALLLFRRKKK
jgi:hypothetical protein